MIVFLLIIIAIGILLLSKEGKAVLKYTFIGGFWIVIIGLLIVLLHEWLGAAAWGRFIDAGLSVLGIVLWSFLGVAAIVIVRSLLAGKRG